MMVILVTDPLNVILFAIVHESFSLFPQLHFIAVIDLYSLYTCSYIYIVFYMLLITVIIVTTGAGLVIGTIIGGISLTTIIALLIIIIIILLYRNKRSKGQLDITITPVTYKATGLDHSANVLINPNPTTAP